MLARTIGLLHATALVVGIIVGASIFVQPSLITGAVPSLGAVYAVWIAAGALTHCGALIAASPRRVVLTSPVSTKPGQSQTS